MVATMVLVAKILKSSSCGGIFFNFPDPGLGEMSEDQGERSADRHQGRYRS
ncbi:uncharacterized protein J3R85_018675 [Psidium guajava]|nr:uncharacterized protein J3R85_018675 [Psidium guajava]